MVLDPSFNCDAMATALGIPNNKHMVRRHLIEEMKMLIESDRCEKRLFTRKCHNGSPYAGQIRSWL